jgi:uncharacterized protein YfaS (alpha-2-macroglobulin family)
VTTFLRSLWEGVCFGARGVRRAVGVAAATVFGRLEWHSPRWLKWLAARGTDVWRYLIARPVRLASFIVVLAAAGGAVAWYLTRPTPHYVTYSVSAPELTEYNDNGISSIKTLKIVFSEAAAPLSQVERRVSTGIELSPAADGSWFWVNDRQLEFTPASDWPVDQEFAVRFAKQGLFARAVLLKKYALAFRTQPFSAQIAESQFYQDPRDPNMKKLVATVKFSHPVDTATLESHVSLAVARDAEYLGLAPDSRHFTVAYDKFHLAAFIHSSPLAMPRDDTPMTLRLDRGVRAARGGNDSRDRLQAVVTIPGRTSLKFTDARMTVVDNARYEPEQILLLSSSSPVVERALAGNVDVHLLPARHPAQPKEDRRPYRWQDESQIGLDIVALSERVAVTYVQSEEGGDTSHGFKFRAPVGRFLLVEVKDGVQGTGGYISGKPYTSIVRIDPYPRALTFLGQGSLLSQSGDRKVGFLSRDVARVDVEVGRVLPNQLQHLTPQMWEYSRPALYGNLEDKLVERFTTTRDYSSAQPGKPTYDSVDLSEYLQDAAPGRRGLFLLHLRASGRIRGSLDDDALQIYDSNNDAPIEDTRLILVTDLGFIVKQAKDGSRSVFVQSIRTGQPVEGARVALVGSNGQAALTATTDASGVAQLPRPDRLYRERTPELVMIEKDRDMSFMPLNTVGRQLNLSRFDTGGVENASRAEQLSTYLFSDRGIYRPGETTHVGVITRTADWKASLAGLPIQIEISDPRGTIVSHTDLKLSATPFDELTYTTPSGAPTGVYAIVAYLTKTDRRRETLGSTSFTVQEFEPDRMKVQLELATKAVAGWMLPDDVKARATVALLFGEPAGKRRVDGEMSLTPALPQFAKYADYRFQIGEVLKEPYRERLTAATTDEAGNAEFALDLKRFTGRAYRLNVLARAFEAEGGRSVAAQNSVIVSDAPYLVGVKPDGDLTFVSRGSVRQVRWLAVGQNLSPVAAEKLTLEWVQRKFVSVLTQQDNRTFKYVSRRKEIPRDARPVRIPAGGTALPLPTGEPGDFMLVLKNESGAVLNSVNYSVAGQANIAGSLERNAELQVQLDKPSYLGGDTIAVSIRAPYVGAGLITIERDRVYHHQWFRTTTTSSVQRVTLPDSFEGNGYVSVQFLRDPSSDELFLSPLSYGVAPFGADLAERTQEVTLAAPRLIKPGMPLTIHVATSEPSRVAIVAVDEGILQVARYRNPDPLAFFFQKRMLEVETRQVLDLILPDFKRFMALAAAGGDADGGFSRHLNPFNRKRKAPAAFWSGVVDVGAGGRDVRYVVPDYFNGRLRIFAVSAGARRMGIADTATEVKGDFVLTPNVPAMIAPGDEFVVSVGVFNNSSGAGAVRIEAQAGAGLTFMGPSGADLEIAEKKEGVGEFRLKAGTPLGPASITFVARRGAAASRMEESVSIRPATPYRTQLTLGRFEGAGQKTPLTRVMFSQRRTVTATVSTLPLAWGEGLVAYLSDYAYSCTEQLVSKGFAALVVAARPEFGVIKSREAAPLESTFSALRSRQNERKGLGLWASSPETAEFPTVYAAHLLVEAKDRGQPFPADFLAQLDGWLVGFASTPASTLGDARARAYAVYLLARQGIRPAGAISNVEQELTRRYPQAWTTDLAAAYLASTYRLLQRTDDAERIIRSVPWSTTQRDADVDIYYDPVVHDAQLLYLISKHFPARLGSTPPAALENISRAISGNRGTSLSTSYTLIALDAMAGTLASSTTFGISEIGADGRERVLAPSAGAMPRAAISEAAATIQLSKRGPAAAYFVVNESGFDKNPPAADLSQGVEIVRDFLDAKGNSLTRVVVGDEFLIRLRVRSTRGDRQPQIAIVDLLPGGVEPVIERQAAADSSEAGADPARVRQPGTARPFPVGVPDKSDWVPFHIDVRDDRLVLYGNAPANAQAFVYRVRATNAGVFQTAPPFAEGMYNRSVVAQGRSGRLEIVKP